MSKTSLIGIAIALCAGFSLAPPQAHAADVIQQCRTADGASVWTDKPCRVLGAQSMPMRGDLAMRLVREQRTEARVSGVEVQVLPTSLRTMAAARQAIGRRSVAGGCARTPAQLEMDLRGAFALGDVNRIAESYDWVGMSQSAATDTMRRLERLARKQVIGARYYDAWIAGSGDSAVGAGLMQVQFGDDAWASVQDFEVARHAGCYFVRF